MVPRYLISFPEGAMTFPDEDLPAVAEAAHAVVREAKADNPGGMDLATPSIAFQVGDLEATHAALVGRGVQATDVGEPQGTRSFAFSDPEGRWFAVTA